eukprot:scaffold10534_cov150-Skeletonema_menzelii.AAC.4
MVRNISPPLDIIIFFGCLLADADESCWAPPRLITEILLRSTSDEYAAIDIKSKSSIDSEAIAGSTDKAAIRRHAHE